MMAQKRLDELLKEEQEPFQLKSYIADRRTKLGPIQLQMRNLCLFSFQASPDLRKSPLFKSPIPALLLEAALRIHKHSRTKKQGFGSIFKRLTNRGRTSVKSRISDQRDDFLDQKTGRCSCNAVWSESSSSSSDQDSSQILDIGYCESPFRFVLQRTPSGHHTPEFLSPPASPCLTKTEEKDKYDVKKLQDGGEEEEEKEQCSPVSVLDAPFEQDYDRFDIEGSYAIVQRAKQQLLKKLQRFEKLAGLDPIELEKRMLENDKEDDEIDVYDDQECCGVGEDLMEPSFHQDWQIPKHMMLLVSDLMAEEEKQQKSSEEEMMKRLESCEDVEANTIDMMVEQDFGIEFGEWNRSQEQVKDMAAELEHAIFGILVQELWS